LPGAGGDGQCQSAVTAKDAEDVSPPPPYYFPLDRVLSFERSFQRTATKGEPLEPFFLSFDPSFFSCSRAARDSYRRGAVLVYRRLGDKDFKASLSYLLSLQLSPALIFAMTSALSSSFSHSDVRIASYRLAARNKHRRSIHRTRGATTVQQVSPPPPPARRGSGALFAFSISVLISSHL
jgi:hypothetical protein